MFTDTHNKPTLGFLFGLRLEQIQSYNMSELCRLCQRDMQMLIDGYTEPMKWVNAHFLGRKYSMLTINYFESLNVLFKDT